MIVDYDFDYPKIKILGKKSFDKNLVLIVMMIRSNSFVIHSFVLIVFLKKSYFFTLTNDRIEYWLFKFCFLKLNIVFKQSKQKNVFKRRWRQAIEYIQRSSQKK